MRHTGDKEMGREKRMVGAAGEEAASSFLKKNGYKVIASNYRTYLGEIDLVAMQGGYTVFVEIKTRTSSSLGPPSLSVTRSKQRHIVGAALIYLKSRGLVDTDWRIDVVSVNLTRALEVEKIEIIENAVQDNYE